MLAEMGEKVDASAAVVMMDLFCRVEKVECAFCSAWSSSGLSSSDDDDDTRRTSSVCVCFVDPFVALDMMEILWQRTFFSLEFPFVVNKFFFKKKE